MYEYVEKDCSWKEERSLGYLTCPVKSGKNWGGIQERAEKWSLSIMDQGECRVHRSSKSRARMVARR